MASLTKQKNNKKTKKKITESPLLKKNDNKMSWTRHDYYIASVGPLQENPTEITNCIISIPVHGYTFQTDIVYLKHNIFFMVKEKKINSNV